MSEGNGAVRLSAVEWTSKQASERSIRNATRLDAHDEQFVSQGQRVARLESVLVKVLVAAVSGSAIGGAVTALASKLL